MPSIVIDNENQQIKVVNRPDQLTVRHSGLIGPMGPTGSRGLTGATGATGPAGQDGTIGVDGATGPRGFTGATGPTGAGTTGATGVQGATGPAGATGPQGLTGAYPVVQQPEAPANTDILWVDTDDETPMNGLVQSVVYPTADYTIGNTPMTNYIYIVNGDYEGTLPSAINNTNKYTIKNNSTSIITVIGTVQGETNALIYPEDALDLISNGANWEAI